jgi:hypothetical protein
VSVRQVLDEKLRAWRGRAPVDQVRVVSLRAWERYMRASLPRQGIQVHSKEGVDDLDVHPAACTTAIVVATDRRFWAVKLS